MRDVAQLSSQQAACVGRAVVLQEALADMAHLPATARCQLDHARLLIQTFKEANSGQRAQRKLEDPSWFFSYLMQRHTMQVLKEFSRWGGWMDGLQIVM